MNGRNNISWTKKFELDVYYVKNIGPIMDTRVFLTTVNPACCSVTTSIRKMASGLLWILLTGIINLHDGM